MRDIQPLKNPCPMDHASSRQKIKDLLREAEARYPGLRERIFGAIQRSALPGWEK